MESLEKKAKVLTRGATGGAGINRDLRDMQEIMSDSESDSDISEEESDNESQEEEEVPLRGS